jgi:hypothetical protein
MANLIQSIELKPQKEAKLQDYLFTEIKNQQKWRHNRSDAFNDQLKFYESYFGKNSFIDKSIMQRFLQDSENIHNENMNYNLSNRTKFIQLVNNNNNNDNNNSNDNNNININQILFSFDNDDKEFEAFNFTIENNKNENENENKNQNEYKIEYKENYDDNLVNNKTVKENNIGN